MVFYQKMWRSSNLTILLMKIILVNYKGTIGTQCFPLLLNLSLAVSIEASQGKYGSMLLQNSPRTDTNIDKHSSWRGETQHKENAISNLKTFL
jgi:hypothetical protein